MAICAGILFVLYTIVSKDVLDYVPTISAVSVIFSISAGMLFPFFFLFETEGGWTGQGVSIVLCLGIVMTSIAYILFSTGLKNIFSSSAVTLSLAEPLTAALLSVVIVGERLSSLAWLGIALLLGGIIVLTFGGKKRII